MDSRLLDVERRAARLRVGQRRVARCAAGSPLGARATGCSRPTSWVWTTGFWAGADWRQVQLLPHPPASVDVGPSSPAPGDNYFWVPGVLGVEQRRLRMACRLLVRRSARLGLGARLLQLHARGQHFRERLLGSAAVLARLVVRAGVVARPQLRLLFRMVVSAPLRDQRLAAVGVAVHQHALQQLLVWPRRLAERLLSPVVGPQRLARWIRPTVVVPSVARRSSERLGRPLAQ